MNSLQVNRTKVVNKQRTITLKSTLMENQSLRSNLLKWNKRKIKFQKSSNRLL